MFKALLRNVLKHLIFLLQLTFRKSVMVSFLFTGVLCFYLAFLYFILFFLLNIVPASTKGKRLSWKTLSYNELEKLLVMVLVSFFLFHF